MEILQYNFFQHALLGSLLASMVCGIIGTYIVSRRLVFISGGLTHASFGGIGLGLYAGISPILSAALFAVASALGIQWLSGRKEMREDSAIALFWTLGMAVGIIFTFLSPGFAPDLSAYLFGNILTITRGDLLLLLVLLLVVGGFFLLFARPILYVAFDREFARSQGIPVRTLEYVLMVFIALAIVACLRMVGIVLVISLLTIPQMTANLFTRRFGTLIWLSMGIGYLSCLGGLLLSYRLSVPSGAAIIFVSILLYAVCKVCKSAGGKKAFCLLFLPALLLSGCSTRKNTAGTRFYHALTTRYNVYFNGHEAYKAGLSALEKGYRDNYLEMLSFYPLNKSAGTLGGGDFDRAIEKAQKAIRVHSIKRRPARKPGRAYTAKYKQWLAQREFNPVLYRAWLLMGKAQYQKGDYAAAAATFSYTARLYQGTPGIVAEASIWLSRCYVAMGWNYEAEDALNRINNDSLPHSLSQAYASAKSNSLLAGERYGELVPYLRQSAAHERDKLQKARHYYLLGQIYQQLSDPAAAYQAYGRTLRLAPPYELALSARIRQTEVMPGGETRKIASRLLRMTQGENNKEFLDQLYYALGNVYLSGRDTLRAVEAYRKGIALSTRGGAEKGLLQLTLANLFWEQRRYADAQPAYTQAIALLDKSHRAYATATARSQVLDELVPHTTAIALQDSLQRLARMSEAERMTVIERLIEQVRAQEEARRKAEEEEALATAKQQLADASPVPLQPARQPAAPTLGGKQAWYFYNPQLVEQGRGDFLSRWGRRKLEDNWRRKNKTVLSDDAFEPIDYNQPDSIAADSLSPAPTPPPAQGKAPVAPDASPAQPTDDEKLQPAYYLAQIPLTPEQLEASNALLSEALYGAGLVFKDRMQEYAQAEALLHRLITQFPDFDKADEVYYQLFLTESAIDYYARNQARQPLAEGYKQTLLERFPQSRYAKLLADPDYEVNARYGKQREDSLYGRTYEAFVAGDTAAVRRAERFSAERYPLGQHRPKFLFLDAITRLQEGQTGAFLSRLKLLVQSYPENEISELAAHILKGVQQGRLLAADSHPFGSIWERRVSLEQLGSLAGDSTHTGALLPPESAFSAERNTPFLFILAYQSGSVSENRLLYEVARYNFSTFVVKNFDLAFVHERGISMLQVTPFANYDEAYRYFRLLFDDKQMAERLGGMRVVLISEANYERLMGGYSFDEYDAFYRSHFAAIPAPDLKGYTLDEPLENLPSEEEEAQQQEEQEKQQSQEPEPADGGVIFE
jgi:ABC-type Mn2+/Zn2+ transport system permease subunit/tetratricopeptide (TPR) repeat protein